MWCAAREILIAEFYLVARGLRHRLLGFSSLDRLVVLRRVSAGSGTNGHTAVVVLRGGLPVSGVGSIGIVPIVKRERGGECSTVYSLPLSKWKSPHLINSSVRPSVRPFALLVWFSSKIPRILENVFVANGKRFCTKGRRPLRRRR